MLKTPRVIPGVLDYCGVKMKVFTVTLNTALDVVVREDDYKESRLKKAIRIPAGKGINVSRALKSNGIPSTAIALVGESEEELFSSVADDLISLHLIPVKGKTRSNITLSFCEDGKEHHTRTKGYKAGEKELDAVRDYLSENVCEGDWVIFSGSLPEGMPSDAYASLIKLCKLRDAYTLLDSSKLALLRGITAGPFAIKPNREELEDILSAKFPRDEEILEYLRKLSDNYGIKIILTTLSEEGAILYSRDRDTVIRLDAYKPKEAVVSSVGCGDSAVAGLVYGFLNYLSFEECLKESMLFANANLYTPVPGELKWGKKES